MNLLHFLDKLNCVGDPIISDRAFFFFGIKQNYLRVPFVVQFQNQAVPITLPGDVSALPGEQRGTNNPTKLFGRTDFILSESNTLNIQYTYTRFRGENFNSADESVSDDSANRPHSERHENVSAVSRFCLRRFGQRRNGRSPFSRTFRCANAGCAGNCAFRWTAPASTRHSIRFLRVFSAAKNFPQTVKKQDMGIKRMVVN